LYETEDGKLRLRRKLGVAARTSPTRARRRYSIEAESVDGVENSSDFTAFVRAILKLTGAGSVAPGSSQYSNLVRAVERTLQYYFVGNAIMDGDSRIFFIGETTVLEQSQVSWKSVVASLARASVTMARYTTETVGAARITYGSQISAAAAEQTWVNPCFGASMELVRSATSNAFSVALTGNLIPVTNVTSVNANVLLEKFYTEGRRKRGRVSRTVLQLVSEFLGSQVPLPSEELSPRLVTMLNAGGTLDTKKTIQGEDNTKIILGFASGKWLIFDFVPICAAVSQMLLSRTHERERLVMLRTSVSVIVAARKDAEVRCWVCQPTRRSTQIGRSRSLVSTLGGRGRGFSSTAESVQQVSLHDRIWSFQQPSQ